jgi:hypothetical protein
MFIGQYEQKTDDKRRVTGVFLAVWLLACFRLAGERYLTVR